MAAGDWARAATAKNPSLVQTSHLRIICNGTGQDKTDLDQIRFWKFLEKCGFPRKNHFLCINKNESQVPDQGDGMCKFGFRSNPNLHARRRVIAEGKVVADTSPYHHQNAVQNALVSYCKLISYKMDKMKKNDLFLQKIMHGVKFGFGSNPFYVASQASPPQL